jgi:hypothetical protein
MPKTQPLLLDLYPNAAVAYSLRKVRTAYSGNAIRVRRSSDNAEQDIGFNSSGELDTTALLVFVGTGILDNGFVTKWYDQSTNVNDATQATVGRQPIIVSGGAILTQSGKQYVRMFQGVTGAFMEKLLNTPIATVGTSSFLVSSYNAIGATSVFGLSATSSNSQYLTQGLDGASPFNLVAFFRNGPQYSIPAFTPTLDQMYITSSHALTTTDRRFFVDNSNSYSSSQSTLSFNATYVLLNRVRRSDIISGFSDLFEFIIYPTEKTADRTAIETSINSYYNVY